MHECRWAPRSRSRLAAGTRLITSLVVHDGASLMACVVGVLTALAPLSGWRRVRPQPQSLPVACGRPRRGRHRHGAQRVRCHTVYRRRRVCAPRVHSHALRVGSVYAISHAVCALSGWVYIQGMCLTHAVCPFALCGCACAACALTRAVCVRTRCVCVLSCTAGILTCFRRSVRPPVLAPPPAAMAHSWRRAALTARQRRAGS
jgi:hypothetical protein